MLVRKGECKRCAKCCIYVGLLIVAPQIDQEWVDAHPGVKIFGEGDTKLMVIHSPCKYLAYDIDYAHGKKTYKCVLYENRPESCKIYPRYKEECMPGCGFYFEEE